MRPCYWRPGQGLIIKPSKGWSFPSLSELWEYRELLYFFAWRDIKVRYKQTALGAAWAVIQPFFTMIVFTIFFGNLANVPSEGIPYPIFAYCALVPWTYFGNALTQSSSSMVANRGIITKVYFPRIIIPIGVMLSGLVDFVIAFFVLLGMMLYYHVVPTAAVVFLPLLVLLSMATALGVGLWLSALNVIYRDVQYAVPFLVQFWLFATPIAYPSTIVPEFYRPIYGLNPMAGVVEGFRWSLLGSHVGVGLMFYVSLTLVGLLLVGGMLYFHRIERTFADIV
jgi:lipopolysaccharide transport system permease protein